MVLKVHLIAERLM